jgi:hypothetical protein
VLLAGLVVLVPLSRAATTGPGGDGSVVVVETAGGVSQRLDPRRDGDVDLEGPLGITRLRIQGGQAWIVASPCAGQLCRRMGRISGPGRVVACLPNRVLVRFEGGRRDVDGITR